MVLTWMWKTSKEKSRRGSITEVDGNNGARQAVWPIKHGHEFHILTHRNVKSNENSCLVQLSDVSQPWSSWHQYTTRCWQEDCRWSRLLLKQHPRIRLGGWRRQPQWISRPLPIGSREWESAYQNPRWHRTIFPTNSQLRTSSVQHQGPQGSSHVEYWQ